MQLSGTVYKTPEVRHSPAGIALTRFTLDHISRQTEAGMAREAKCRIVVIIAGDVLNQQCKQLHTGQEVSVTGFISRMDNRQGNSMIVLHANQISIGEGSATDS